MRRRLPINRSREGAIDLPQRVALEIARRIQGSQPAQGTLLHITTSPEAKATRTAKMDRFRRAMLSQSLRSGFPVRGGVAEGVGVPATWRLAVYSIEDYA